MFQFHEGPIKTLFAKTFNKKYGELSFNSMKVRLKLAQSH
ncbi:unknown [Prevotella sp. CAG:5226]|nr:unknown [Prevotella sp. CAG:5226]